MSNVLRTSMPPKEWGCVQEQLPALPPELLEPIARLALEAAGGDVRAWARLSLVSTGFRDAIRGGRPIPRRAPVWSSRVRAVRHPDSAHCTPCWPGCKWRYHWLCMLMHKSSTTWRNAGGLRTMERSVWASGREAVRAASDLVCHGLLCCGMQGARCAWISRSR